MDHQLEKLNLTTVDINGRAHTLSVKENFSKPALGTTFFYLLSHLSILEVKGEDAESFLQGQLTIDVNQDKFTLGCYCNREGRILQLFYLVKHKDSFLMMLPSDMIASFEKKLGTYAKFSKVELQQLNTTPIFMKEVAKDTAISLEVGENNLISQNTLEHYLLVSKQEDYDKLISHTSEYYHWQGSLGWHFLFMNKLVPSLYPNTQNHFLPHKIYMHELEALDFEKGCYIGQEIIARMHYRAKQKHQMYLYLSDIPQTPGDEINFNQKKIGEVVDICPLKNQQLTLASIQISGVEEFMQAHPSFFDI